MGQHGYIYGLDIETDTTHGGLDPAVSSVVTIALCGPAFDEVLIGEEPAMLRALDERLADLPPGVLATWNGGSFDLPFLADRARLLGVDLGLHLCLDRRLTLGRTPLPGHAGAYRGSWHQHGHLDTFRLYGNTSGPSHWISLRTIGRLVGLGPQAGATRRAHDLTNEALHAHAPSDARLARVLAERRWSAATRLVDRIEADEVESVSRVDARIERMHRAEARPVGTAIASA